MLALFGVPDRSKYIEFVAARPATIGVGVALAVDYLFITDEVSVMRAEVRSSSPDHGVNAVQAHWNAVQWNVNGQIVGHDIYDDHDGDRALAAAEVLAAETKVHRAP
jgi:hypothetical protein